MATYYSASLVESVMQCCIILLAFTIMSPMIASNDYCYFYGHRTSIIFLIGVIHVYIRHGELKPTMLHEY